MTDNVLGMVFNGKLCPPDWRVSMKSLVSLELEKSGDAFPLDGGSAPATCGHFAENTMGFQNPRGRYPACVAHTASSASS